MFPSASSWFFLITIWGEGSPECQEEKRGRENGIQITTAVTTSARLTEAFLFVDWSGINIFLAWLLWVCNQRFGCCNTSPKLVRSSSPVCLHEFWRGTKKNPIFVMKTSCRLWLVCVYACLHLCLSVCLRRLSASRAAEVSFFSNGDREKITHNRRPVCVRVCVCACVRVCVCEDTLAGIFLDCWQAWKCHFYILLQDMSGCHSTHLSGERTHTDSHRSRSSIYRQLRHTKT